MFFLLKQNFEPVLRFKRSLYMNKYFFERAKVRLFK